MRKGRQVRCIETGEIFDSIRELAEAMSTSYNIVYDRIRFREQLNGKHYEFVKIKV